MSIIEWWQLVTLRSAGRFEIENQEILIMSKKNRIKQNPRAHKLLHKHALVDGRRIKLLHLVEVLLKMSFGRGISLVH